MFSTRLHWDLHPNSLSESIAARRRRGEPILDLTESNPTAAGLDLPADAILGAYSDPSNLRYEPTPAGLESARAAISGYYAGRGWTIDPARILLTTSTSEAYGYLFKLLTDPGDEILAPRPSYPLFEFLAGMELVRMVPYPLHYSGGWWMDLDALAAAVTPRTRAVVVVHPNNPTGSYVKQREAERLAALCAERDIAILSDEVFADYSFSPDPSRQASFATIETALTFSLSGLSKIAGMPQMKLGWIVTGGPEHLQQQARERLELIADTYLSVSTPVQHAAPRLLAAGTTIREAITTRTRRNLEQLRAQGLRILDVEGGWYAILPVPRTRSEEEWTTALLDATGVLVQPGYFYDFESDGQLVLSLLTESSVFDEGISRLRGYLEPAL